MNKNELIEQVTNNAEGLSKAQVTQVLDLMLNAIGTTLKQGGEVKFVGFGTFKTAKRAETTGRNPKTGETIKIAASTRVKFTPGKELKEAVNG